MDNFYARSVFFVRDAEASLAFYTQNLGFEKDWVHEHEGRAWVFEVSLFGFCLILNQVWGDTTDRAGHGRAFIGLSDDQSRALSEHIRAKGIPVSRDDWGRPTMVIKDMDGNELFFWSTDAEFARLESEIPELKQL
jgi:catechol 2,3-dioxygenase-like lactoylglutathione lyase family enzyme